MAESDSVAQLEQDLRQFLGISTNTNTAKSSDSVHKKPDTSVHESNSNLKIADGSVGKKPNASKGKNQESTQKRPPKPRANQRRQVSQSEAPSSSTSEDAGKGRENASASTKNGNGQEKDHTIKTNSLKQQNISNQPTNVGGFIRDRRWHPDDQRVKNSSSKGTKVFNRTSNSEEIPQNWRQPAPKICQVPRKIAAQVMYLENGTVVEQNSSKRSSLSEIVPHNVNKDPNPVLNSCQEKSEGAKAKSREKFRARKETSKKERVDLASNLALQYDEVPKHLQESNYPTGIVPLAPSLVNQQSVARDKKDATQPALQGIEARHGEMQIPHVAVPEEEEIVRIVVMPTLPQQKRKKPAKSEKKDEPKKADDGSSSSSSSSSEEEQKLRRNEIQQPLLFNIRKTELDLFRKKGVLPLKHISPKFPRAIFHCRLCSFHISSIPEVYRHTKDDRHVRLQNQEMSRQTASLMPSPPPEIVEVVGQFIQDIFHCSGLTKEDLEIRRAATENLRKMIEMAFPGYSIRPYGSVVTGTFTRKKKCLTSYKYLLYIILIFV